MTTQYAIFFTIECSSSFDKNEQLDEGEVKLDHWVRDGWGG